MTDDLEPVIDPDPFPHNGGIDPSAGTALTIHDVIDPQEEPSAC
ncbi:MAG: hypothetical protein Q7V58_09585 [Actinomycetota bacterium]|nr:hypothetical protein [Actinomycetota bacterium]